MYNFTFNCVGCSKDKLDLLFYIVDNNNKITYKTFLSKVNRKDLNRLIEGFGYAKNSRSGLTFKKDWHISFHKAKYEGKLIYFFCHSAIEYVFEKEVLNNGN